MKTELIDWLHKRTKVENGHWLWVGGHDTKGYGKAKYNGTMWSINRLSLCIFTGAPYKGDWVACHIDSICKHPSCWNPLHLYVGTASSNMVDFVSTGRHREARKTHCVNGHEFSIENTLSRADGGRRCKVCRDLANRRYQQCHG
jgi:hypothetical protein